MSVVFIIIVGLFAGVGSLIAYRHVKLKTMDRARKEIIIDLQELHNSKPQSNSQ